MKFWNFRGRWANVIPLREKKIQFGVVEKKLCCPNGFFLFLGRAGCENYTNPKIWLPCPKMGQGWPWKRRGRVESQASFSFLPPSSSLSPWPWGGEAKGRPLPAMAAGRTLPPDRSPCEPRPWQGGGGAWKRGCMGWIHAPPPPLAVPPKIC
jgi:hypothetical protein